MWRGVKRYDLMHPWEVYGGQLDVEYRQCMEEGLDVESLRPLFDAIGKLPAGERREKLAEELFQAIRSAPRRADYPYEEPSDYEGILSARSAERVNLPQVDTAAFPARVEGAWLGRVCGCLLGKPVEGWMSGDIEKLCRDTGNYPLSRYMEGPEGRCFVNRLNGYMPYDDDTNYTVMACEKLVGRYGRGFTPQDVARVWLDTQPMSAYCTAERVAFRNFVEGYFPPESAWYKNPYREWIGAQIRGDYFGYINPGDPERAAEMAFRDASISHVKNGIYGEMWAAAMIAAAAVVGDAAACVRAGLGEIPETSRLHEAVSQVLAWQAQGVGQKEAFERIHQRFDERNSHDWCHTISNAMIVAACLLYGGLDFGKSVCMAVETGFDTDCNAATVGSVLGMMGVEIGAEWTGPVRDTVETTLFGLEKVSIARMAEKTVAHWKQK